MTRRTNSVRKKFYWDHFTCWCWPTSVFFHRSIVYATWHRALSLQFSRCDFDFVQLSLYSRPYHDILFSPPPSQWLQDHTLLHFGISFTLHREVPILVSKIRCIDSCRCPLFFCLLYCPKEWVWALTVRWFTRGIHVLTKSCIACTKVRMPLVFVVRLTYIINRRMFLIIISLIRRSFLSFISITFCVS